MLPLVVFRAEYLFLKQTVLCAQSDIKKYNDYTALFSVFVRVQFHVNYKFSVITYV